MKEKPYTEQIRALKTKIKALVETQKKNKLARRTVRIDPELRKKLLEELGIKYPEYAHAGVMARKAEITAHLNLYLELRGKSYRHNEPKDPYWRPDYVDAMQRLRAEFKLS